MTIYTVFREILIGMMYVLWTFWPATKMLTVSGDLAEIWDSEGIPVLAENTTVVQTLRFA